MYLNIRQYTVDYRDFIMYTVNAVQQIRDLQI